MYNLHLLNGKITKSIKTIDCIFSSAAGTSGALSESRLVTERREGKTRRGRSGRQRDSVGGGV